MAVPRRLRSSGSGSLLRYTGLSLSALAGLFTLQLLLRLVAPLTEEEAARGSGFMGRVFGPPDALPADIAAAQASGGACGAAMPRSCAGAQYACLHIWGAHCACLCQAFKWCAAANRSAASRGPTPPPASQLRAEAFLDSVTNEYRLVLFGESVE